MTDVIDNDEYMSTVTTFLKPATMKIGAQLKLIYQEMDDSDYGPYCVWVNPEGTTRYGLTTSGIKSAIQRGVVKPGDSCLLTYEGTEESPKKGFKPFHKFNIRVKRGMIGIKPSIQAATNPNIEATKATWSDFNFEEI